MEKTLLFGAAYYPEYMPYEHLDQDISMMKAAGMNVVRIAESTWSTLEPEEGVFNFSYIDRVIEKTQDADMMVIIGTPTYAVPPWLIKEDPDILVERKTGKAQYGYRQLINLLNPTYRSHAETVIRKLVAHTQEKKMSLVIRLIIETKHYGNMGSEIQQAFQKYLEKKFVTTEKFNETFGLAYWSNSIHHWDDLPDIKGCINEGSWLNLKNFSGPWPQNF